MNTMHRFPRPARHFLGTGVQGFDAVKHCTQKVTVLSRGYFPQRYINDFENRDKTMI